MTAGHQVRRYLPFGVTVPASSTTQVQNFAINDEMRLNLVVDCLLGQVAGTPTLTLQDSTGYGFWNSLKTDTLSASTDKSVTVSGSTWTATAHGYTAGEVVVINSTGNMPGGVHANARHYVQNPTANTFQLTRDNNPTAAPIVATDSGTGSLTATAATVTTIRMNVEVSADQAAMPLRPLGRILATTTSGQTVQVLDVMLGYTY